MIRHLWTTQFLKSVVMFKSTCNICMSLCRPLDALRTLSYLCVLFYAHTEKNKSIKTVPFKIFLSCFFFPAGERIWREYCTANEESSRGERSVCMCFSSMTGVIWLSLRVWRQETRAGGVSRRTSASSSSGHLYGPCGWRCAKTGSFCTSRTAAVAGFMMFLCGYGFFVGAWRSSGDKATTPPWTRSTGNYGACGSRCPARSWGQWTSTWACRTPPRRWGRNASFPLSRPCLGRGSRTPLILRRCARKTFTTPFRRSWCQSGSPITWI